MYLWPHLEILKTVTYETEDPFSLKSKVFSVVIWESFL